MTTAAPTKKSLASSIWLGIVLAPFGLGFIIAACLSAGPTEVFNALTNRD